MVCFTPLPTEDGTPMSGLESRLLMLTFLLDGRNPQIFSSETLPDG